MPNTELPSNQQPLLRQRFMFLAGGVLTGLCAYAFAMLADFAQSAFGWIRDSHGLAAFLLTPCGFAVAAFAAERFVPGSAGSGIPQCIAAMQSKDAAIRTTLSSVRTTLGKILLTVFGLLCGASIGREGPTVQVGASIMLQLGKLFHREQKGLILAGSAAGIAAAFNAPLAGIVFAIEELSRSFESKTSGIILTTTILAGLTATALGGNYAYFGYVSGGIGGMLDWAALVLVAVAGGLLGGLFSWAVVAASRSKALAVLTSKSRPAFAFACGLGIALCGWISGGSTYGTGYAEAYSILHEQANEPWLFVPLKIIATGLSSLSGVPGGLFSPSLSIGAGLGSLVAQFLNVTNTPQLALLGMTAYLTGVVQSPITAVVIMAEMTDNHRMVIPLLACALLADWVSKQIQPQGIYHALAGTLLSPQGSRSPPDRPSN